MLCSAVLCCTALQSRAHTPGRQKPGVGQTHWFPPPHPGYVHVRLVWVPSRGSTRGGGGVWTLGKLQCGVAKIQQAVDGPVDTYQLSSSHFRL